jgi:PKD repeat protein
MFIFRNASGFTRPQSDGGFSWVEPTTTGTTYLDGFYTTAKSLIQEYSTGSGYKGFDDSIAAWTQHRMSPQQCGQAWLTSIADAGNFYSASTQMLGIQMVTWNDYEEGTEIETGIDNCVAVSASLSGSTVSWSITGQMNTVDHFSVFASQDGQNLMWLADAATTVSSLDLAQFGLPAGNYTVFVKATGKPSLTNKMSAGAAYTAGSTSTQPVAVLNVTPVSGNAPLTVTADTTGSSAPGGSIASTTINFGDGSATVNAVSSSHTYNTNGTYTVTATVTDNHGATATKTAAVTVGSTTAANLSLNVPPGGSAATVKAGQSATFALQLAATGNPFSVTITCTGAPTKAACSGPASPITVTPGASANVPITVSTTASAGLLPAPQGKTNPPMLWLLPVVSMAAWFFGSKKLFMAVKRLLSGSGRRAWKPAFVAPLLLLACGTVMTGCGSASSNTTKPTVSGTPAGTYTLVVTATSGSTTRSTQLTLTVQ